MECRGFRLKKRNMLEVLDFELDKPGFIQTFWKTCAKVPIYYSPVPNKRPPLTFFFPKKLVMSLPKRGKVKELKSQSKANLQSPGILQNHYYETRSPVEMKKNIFLKIHWGLHVGNIIRCSKLRFE